MSNEQDIDITIFDEPSGSVRGTVVASMTIKGKSKRIGHATLLVGEAPLVSIEIPKKLSLDQLDELTDILRVFAYKVRESA